MNEPIANARTALGGETVPTVNARDLHRFLEVGKDFSTWIKAQIERGRLVENRDYVTFENLSSPNSGSAKARPQVLTEYALTLEAAKHIGMMSGTEKGFEVREYFIACEKRAKATVALARDPIEVLNDPAAMRGLLLTYSEKVISLEAKVAESAPKADFYDRFSNADGLYGLENAGRALGLGPRKFCRFLAQKHMFHQGGVLVPYVQFRQAGLFEIKSDLVDDKVRMRSFITPKGLQYFAKLLGRPVPGEDLFAGATEAAE